MVTKALLDLSPQEKNLLKTFSLRRQAVPLLLEHVGELVTELESCKQNPQNKGIALLTLNKIKQEIMPNFANLDLSSVIEEESVLRQVEKEKTLEFEQLLRDFTSGEEERKTNAQQKINRILADRQQQLERFKETEDAAKQMERGVKFFKDNIPHMQQLHKRFNVLVKETEEFTPEEYVIDHLMHEWGVLGKEIASALDAEKREVFDVIQPFLQKAKWAESLAEERINLMQKALAHLPSFVRRFTTKKITKRDVMHDLSTMTTEAEFAKYVVKLLRHKELLLDEAADYLEHEGLYQIEEQEAKLKRTTQLATNDEKMGLLRAHMFETRVKEQLQMAHRTNSSLGFIFIDIDNFGEFNKKYSELVGDIVLWVVANIIRARIRETDIAGRWGGEEIVIATPFTDVKGTAQLAVDLCETIRNESKALAEQELRNRNMREREINPITVSVGVAMYPEDGEEFEQLMLTANKREQSSKGPKDAPAKNRITFKYLGGLVKVKKRRTLDKYFSERPVTTEQ